MTRLFTLFTLLISLQAHAHIGRGAPTPAECAEALRPGFESWAVIAHEDGPREADRYGHRVMVYELYVGLKDNPRYEVGALKVEREGDTLRIIDIEITDDNDEAFKRRGVSRYLFAKALAQFPDVKAVQGSLFFDNADAFHEAFKATGNVNLGFRNTPFYRAFASLGFSQIDESRTLFREDILKTGLLILTLKRPDAEPVTTPDRPTYEQAVRRSGFELSRKPMP